MSGLTQVNLITFARKYWMIGDFEIGRPQSSVQNDFANKSVNGPDCDQKKQPGENHDHYIFNAPGYLRRQGYNKNGGDGAKR